MSASNNPSSFKNILFWLITISIPIVLLAFLEIGLRLADYRAEYQDLFIPVPDHQDLVIANPSFSTRYFPAFKPQIAPNTFKREKTENTFRVFVLGGSSAQGFPYNYYHSFAANLERSLIAETVGLNIEVINLGMTAVNSYVLQDIAARILPYEPDAIVIYAGHNEYYGSFGVGTSMFGFGRSVAFKRLILTLKDLRLFQLIEQLLASDKTQRQNRTLMAEVVKESSIELEGDIYFDGLEQFDKNLSSMVLTFTNNAIPVYLGTLAANLADQAPMSDNSEALTAFELGKRFINDAQADSAAYYLELAKELDEIRFRAPNEINEIIKSYKQLDNAYVVDIKELAAEDSENQIPGNNWFTDHLHPTAQANQAIGTAYFNIIAETHPKLKSHLFATEVPLDLTVSTFENTYADVQISRLIFGYPFVKNQSAEQERIRFENYYNEQLNKSFIDSLAALTWRTQRQVSLSLTDIVNFSTAQGDSLQVMQHYVPLAYLQLLNKNLLLKGANYALNNRKLDSYSMLILQLAAKNYPDELFIPSSLAAVYLVNKDLVRAEYWLKQAEIIKADDTNMLYNFARLYAIKKDSANARLYFEKYRAATGN